MRTSIQVGKLIGIPIRLHFTFLFILPLIVMMFAHGYTLSIGPNSPIYSLITSLFAKDPTKPIPLPLGLGGIEMSPFLRYSLSSIAAFFFFVSLLLHEMSHSYVAMKYGTRIHSITLHLFGGLAMMEDIPKDPRKEWKIAIAGPLMSFALGGVFLLTFWGIRPLNLVIYPVKILVFILGFWNVILGTFNLLPAFPMDGGRVLRALLAKRMPFLKATRRAVLVGKIFAVTMAMSGIVADPFMFILTGERVPNFFIVGIAIILYIIATEEEAATITFASLEGIKVKNVMRTERTSVLEDMPIVELANKMLAEKNAEYAVVSESGELKGFITFDEIKKLSAEQRYFLRVSDAISSFDSISDIVLEEEAATEALKRMIRNRRNVLAVKEAMSGDFVGVITRRDLAIYMEMLKGSV
ncbi:MAG: site-2 protease family protein [Methanophagales archaeon]|nr:site-2 protease family protein [Methanophagales archaeon]